MLHVLDNDFHTAVTRTTHHVAHGRARGKQVSSVLTSDKKQQIAEMGVATLFGAAGLGALIFALIEKGSARYLSGAMFLVALYMIISFARRK